MKAIVITDQSEPVQMADIPKPSVGKGECLVKIKTSALNRRDQWIREGMYPRIIHGTVLGSDGFGEVVEGEKEWIGKEVVINPNVNWGENPEVQASDYSVLGMPVNGTLAEYIKVSIHRLHKKPSNLSAEEAAALPLAGLTAFRAVISKGVAKTGKRVLITGAGGGVSQLAIAFSVASGAETFVTSGSDQKIEKSIKMGAKTGFNYKNDSWYKEAGKLGGFDAIIDSAGGNHLNSYLKIVKPAGRIVMYGSTTGYPEKLDVFRLFWSQSQIIGSTMGNDQEFSEMLQWVERHGIQPAIDKVFAFDDYLAAFNRFNEADSFGKIVLKW